MMETWLFQHFTSANLIIIVQSILVIASFLVITKILNVQQQQSKLIIQMKNEIKAINSGNIGIGRKMNLFGKEIAKAEVDKITQLQPGSQEKTYHQASILLKRGASIEEVVDSCDVAPAEAELLAIMSHAREVSDHNKKITKNNHSIANEQSDLSIAS
ncbi:MAG: hypothetical protein ACJAS9_002793 [Polaribacter sp.]|jgi:hypothetical protein